METHRFNLNRLKQLEELLDEVYTQLHEYKVELLRAAGGDQRVRLRRQINVEIIPNIRQLEREYAECLVAGIQPDAIPEDEAEILVTEVVGAIERADRTNAPQDMLSLLNEIRDGLKEPGKSASAKLKLNLPIIPLIASYEMEMDTEGVVTQVWRKFRGIFRRLVPQNPC